MESGAVTAIAGLGCQMQNVSWIHLLSSNPIGDILTEAAAHPRLITAAVGIAEFPQASLRPISHRNHHTVLIHRWQQRQTVTCQYPVLPFTQVRSRTIEVQRQLYRGHNALASSLNIQTILARHSKTDALRSASV